GTFGLHCMRAWDRCNAYQAGPDRDMAPFGSDTDNTTAANFLQARASLGEEGKEAVLLDFEMLNFDPSPTTVGLRCSLDNVRKLVHTCLEALLQGSASLSLAEGPESRPAGIGRASEAQAGGTGRPCLLGQTRACWIISASST